MAHDPRDLPPAEPRGEPITFELEGDPVHAHAGEPLAVALWAAGVRVLGRSPKYHRPRGMFCLEGHCASCLLRIDGRPSRRACLVPVAAGLRCERQNAFPDVDHDLLRAADWLFPGGMDHHRLMTGTRLGNELFMKLVREMGGSGTLPDAAPAAPDPVRNETVDVCIVGAGPAGLAAAATLGARAVVVDEQDRPGGSLMAEPGGVKRAAELARAAEQAGANVWSQSTAIAYYAEEGVLAVATPRGLVRVTARRFLYTTGAYDQNLPFPDSDRAGVMSARACGRLAFRWGIRPGRRVVVLSDPAVPFPFVGRLERGLAAVGVETRAATVGDLGAVDLKREVIAVAALPAPASELPRQHGARVRLDVRGFVVEVDAAFAAAPQVHAAGDVTGYVGPDAAAAAGGAAARALMQ